MPTSTAHRRPHRGVAGLIASAVVVLSAVLTTTAAAMPLEGMPARTAGLPRCTIFGTAGSDVLRGTPGDDVICAVDGNDRVRGGRGDDVIFGSGGADRLYGGRGDDKLYGFTGRDHLHGGRGNDLLQGAAGADVLSGGRGTDTADYHLRRHDVRVTIGAGAADGARTERDDVRADVERVRGGHGDDVLIGDGGLNRLYGGRGDDSLRGGRGHDRLYGGRGRDRLAARDGGARDSLHCGAGRRDLALADARDRVASDCERVHRRHRRRSHSPHPPHRRNHGPTTIALGDDRVPENAPAGTTVGRLVAADRDARQHHVFALVTGPGGGDNRSFSIDGSVLKTAAVFDYEAKRSYSIRVRATDDGHPARSVERVLTVLVTDVNESPTAISLTPATVAENHPIGTAVGTLAAADPDAGDHHAFALVAGPGAIDNASFTVNGATLRTAAVLDFESQSSYSIRVRATDAGGFSVERTLTVTVTDAPELPIAQPKSVTGVTEDASKAITLSGTDPQGSPLTFAIVSGPQHGALSTRAPAATCDAARPRNCTARLTYTPDPDFNGADTFTYRVDDGSRHSAPATVSIRVDPVNDAPEASGATLSTKEDTPVGLGALVSDVETRDADLTYTMVSRPSHGAVTTTGGTPMYVPEPDFNGTDSFTYEVTDRGDPDNCSGGACDAPKTSAPKTVDITVDPVNDAPQAADAGRSVDEDDTLPTDLTALVSDVETSDANLTYTILGGPAHGTLTGSGGSRTYTPYPDYSGPESFTYRVTDRGDPDNCGAPGPGCDGLPESSATRTVSITVNPVDDAPVNSVPAGPLTAVQDADTPIANVSLSDIDAAGDDVQLTLSALQGTLTVGTAVPGGVSPLQVVGNGTKTVVVTASLLATDTTLADANGLVYHGDAAYTGPDTLTVASDDLGHNGSGGPLTDTDTIALSVEPPNQPPVADDQSATTSEDTAKTITLTAKDADGDDPLTFAIASPPTRGSLGSIGAVACDHATPNTCTADVTYTPEPDASGPDSFTFTASDGRADSAAATFSITVTAVNDAPKLQGVESTALAYTENDPATQITSSTTVSDVDSPNFDTGTLTVDFGAGGTADDRLEIADQGEIGVSGSDVTFSGNPIGTFAGGTGTTPLVVTLNANADATATPALVRAITYRNVSDDPSTTARTVRLVLTDGDGGTSAPATRGIALTAVNDAPTLAGIESAAADYTESVDSAPSTSEVTNSLTVADPDDTSLSGATVEITAGCHSGEDVLTYTSQHGITGTYTAATCRLVLTGPSSLADYQAALRSIEYENTSDTPDTTVRTVTFTVDDGTDVSNAQARDVTLTAANDWPTGVGDTFNGSDSALAGVTLAVSTSPSTPNVSVSGTVLGNDTDPDSPHADLTASAGSSSAQGGVVALNSDGTFTYTPAPGFTGSDTFTYTVHDNAAAGPGTGTGTVTINVAGPRVWFVNPGDPAAGNGTSASPLNSLAPLSPGGGSDGLDGNGDVIFVHEGNATSGGFVLEADQRLVGQPQGLSVTNANGTYDLVTAGGANPTIANTAGAGLTLADGNTIQRVDVTGSTGVGVTGTGVNTLTYGANTTISGNTGGGLSLSGAAGGAISVGADISASSGRSVSIANRTSGTTSLTGAVNDTGTGISLSSNTGATITFGGGVTVSTGANAAFSATGGGTVNVTGASNTLATTTASALNVANTTIGAGGLTFKSIAANGAANGIVLDNTGSSGGLTVTGTGTTAGSGGTIQSSTDAGILLTSTKSPSFSNVRVQDGGDDGIRGSSVNGFTLAGSTISGNGDTVNESGLDFTGGLTGTASISGSTVGGSPENGLIVTDASGSLNLTVSDSTMNSVSTADTGNDGIHLDANDTAGITANITGSTFSDNRGDQFQFSTNATATGTSSVTFSNNTLTGDRGSTYGGTNLGGGVTISTDGGSHTSYLISDNDITGAVSSAITADLGTNSTAAGTLTGTIDANTIGNAEVVDSGSSQFNDVSTYVEGSGTHTVAITDNTLRQYSNLAGIDARIRDGSPTLNATITGNTIATPGTFASNGLFVQGGAATTDGGTICAAISANTMAGSGANGSTDFRLRQRLNTTVRLPGYGGTATDTAAVVSFVQGNNPGNPTGSATVPSPSTGGGFVGGTACPTPP